MKNKESNNKTENITIKINKTKFIVIAVLILIGALLFLRKGVLGENGSNISNTQASIHSEKSGRGGFLTVTKKSEGNVILNSDRFFCGPCIGRLERDLKKAVGITNVQIYQNPKLMGVFDITYDPSKINIKRIAKISEASLESDPANSDPVKVIIN